MIRVQVCHAAPGGVDHPCHDRITVIFCLARCSGTAGTCVFLQMQRPPDVCVCISIQMDLCDTSGPGAAGTVPSLPGTRLPQCAGPDSTFERPVTKFAGGRADGPNHESTTWHRVEKSVTESCIGLDPADDRTVPPGAELRASAAAAAGRSGHGTVPTATVPRSRAVVLLSGRGPGPGGPGLVLRGSLRDSLLRGGSPGGRAAAARGTGPGAARCASNSVVTRWERPRPAAGRRGHNRPGPTRNLIMALRYDSVLDLATVIVRSRPAEERRGPARPGSNLLRPYHRKTVPERAVRGPGVFLSTVTGFP
eukprot:768587-Hanusia_phi.AAC.9